MIITFIRALILYILVIITMRLMGKRQIGQLQPFELAVTIMIAELASVPMGNTGIPLVHGVIPILTLLFAQIVVSIITIKSNSAENIISGQPTIVIQNGKINVANLEKELYTISDLVEQLRLKDYPTLEDIEFAILESSGNISVVPKPAKRAPTLEDLSIPSKYQGLTLPVIIDGKILLENLEPLGLDLGQLHNILNQNSIPAPKTVIYASVDSSGNLFYQTKNQKET